MPCPYFEPLTAMVDPTHPNARLPLIDEYDGLCHALESPVAAPGSMRLRFCNHGNSKGCCAHFPEAEERSCLRYSITFESETTIELTCIEEDRFWPLRWRSLRYSIAAGQIESQCSDLCLTAQANAFCRSYIRRFRPTSAQRG